MVGGIHKRNLSSATPAKAINTASCITILSVLIDDDQP
jgi:hypothetical protein